MPTGRKRSYAKSFTRRVKRRRRIRGRTKNVFRRPYKRRSQVVKMFPKKQLVELTYCDTVTIPSLDAGSAPYKFRLNSVYDPDLTSTGHQPRGHDQWSAIYKRYCVIGANVLVEPLNSQTNTNVDATLFGYVDDDETSDLHTIEQLRELNLPKTTHKYVELGQSAVGVTRYKSPNLSYKIGMKKFFGIAQKSQVFTPAGLGQGDSAPQPSSLNPYGLTAVTNANPTNVCHLKLHAQTNYPGAEQTVTCRVTIKYLCVYHDPIEVGAS